jgi:hypothetical protein
MTLPAYVIHHPSQSERDDLVDRIVAITGAKVVEAVMIKENPTLGCRSSHRKVAELAKAEHPLSAYLVFENDCEILNENFLNLTNDVDVLYFGITGYCTHFKPFTHLSLWGTHAMMITPKARDLFLETEHEYLKMNFVDNNHPIDQLWSVLIQNKYLSYWFPPAQDIQKYVRQKPGLQSSISGKLRT